MEDAFPPVLPTRKTAVLLELVGTGAAYEKETI